MQRSKNGKHEQGADDGGEGGGGCRADTLRCLSITWWPGAGLYVLILWEMDDSSHRKQSMSQYPHVAPSHQKALILHTLQHCHSQRYKKSQASGKELHIPCSQLCLEQFVNWTESQETWDSLSPITGHGQVLASTQRPLQGVGLSRFWEHLNPKYRLFNDKVDCSYFWSSIFVS